jgi:hypothetical protein
MLGTLLLLLRALLLLTLDTDPGHSSADCPLSQTQ